MRRVYSILISECHWEHSHIARVNDSQRYIHTLLYAHLPVLAPKIRSIVHGFVLVVICYFNKQVSVASFLRPRCVLQLFVCVCHSWEDVVAGNVENVALWVKTGQWLKGKMSNRGH